MEARKGLPRPDVASPAQQVALVLSSLAQPLAWEGKGGIHQVLFAEHSNRVLFLFNFVLANVGQLDQIVDV